MIWIFGEKGSTERQRKRTGVHIGYVPAQQEEMGDSWEKGTGLVAPVGGRV